MTRLIPWFLRSSYRLRPDEVWALTPRDADVLIRDELERQVRG